MAAVSGMELFPLTLSASQEKPIHITKCCLIGLAGGTWQQNKKQHRGWQDPEFCLLMRVDDGAARCQGQDEMLNPCLAHESFTWYC